MATSVMVAPPFSSLFILFGVALIDQFFRFWLLAILLDNFSMLSNMISSVKASSVPPVMSGPSGVTSIVGSMPGSMSVSSTGQVTTHNSSPAFVASATSNVPGNSSLQASSTIQSAERKYVKEWEGNLYAKRQGQPVLLTRLEGYRSAKASETLLADWPLSLEIVRLISWDHMNNKQYVGKADFLVFRANNQHGFLRQLLEKKICAVIQLPSQTLLLSVSDKAYRLIGMLFPGDMVVFNTNPTTAIATSSTATEAAAASTNEAAASTTATTMPGGTSMS